MFFPLKDENPTTTPPIVTVGIIVVCTLVFLLEYFGGPQGMQRMILKFGLIPGVLLGTDALSPNLNAPSAPITLFTSMFLHGGWLHLLSNMWFLWIFGNNIEEELGHWKFLLFYILSGFGAAFLQIAIEPASIVPMVGASGAISGVLGAYMLLHPRVKILTLLFLGFFITVVRITAIWFLGIWFGIQILYGLAAAGGAGQGGIAWWAHIGGFVAGVGLLYVMRSRRRGPFPRLARTPREVPKDKPSRSKDDPPRGPWG